MTGLNELKMTSDATSARSSVKPAPINRQERGWRERCQRRSFCPIQADRLPVVSLPSGKSRISSSSASCAGAICACLDCLVVSMLDYIMLWGIEGSSQWDYLSILVDAIRNFGALRVMGCRLDGSKSRTIEGTQGTCSLVDDFTDEVATSSPLIRMPPLCLSPKRGDMRQRKKLAKIWDSVKVDGIPVFLYM